MSGDVLEMKKSSKIPKEDNSFLKWHRITHKIFKNDFMPENNGNHYSHIMISAHNAF